VAQVMEHALRLHTGVECGPYGQMLPQAPQFKRSSVGSAQYWPAGFIPAPASPCASGAAASGTAASIVTTPPSAVVQRT
jgi:hypothetical protein